MSRTRLVGRVPVSKVPVAADVSRTEHEMAESELEGLRRQKQIGDAVRPRLFCDAGQALCD